MGGLIVKAVLHYIENHPEVIQRLITAIVNAVIDHIETPPSSATITVSAQSAPLV